MDIKDGSAKSTFPPTAPPLPMSDKDKEAKPDADDELVEFGPGELEFMKGMSEWWRRAMNGGWVEKYIDVCMTDDVVVIDHIPSPRSVIVTGKTALCLYYNKILRMHFPLNPSVTWETHSFKKYANGKMTAQNDVRAEWPTGHTYVMKVIYEYQLEGHLVKALVMRPKDLPSDRVRTSRLINWNRGMQEFDPSLWKQYRQEAGISSGSPPCDHNHWDNLKVKRGWITLRCRICLKEWQQPADRQCASFNSPHGCNDDCSLLHVYKYRLPDPMEQVEKKETASGVSLTRPCLHNSWDNVRIKRGWIILRCRICQAQWRQRPSSESRCHDFNTDEGCPQGHKCKLLHVHLFKQTLAERQAVAAADQDQQQLDQNKDFSSTIKGRGMRQVGCSA
eukprot:Sspe_Gene.91943::Locus_63612_Transcript_2_2_Confidence_0.500_Length_1404::g.91943::m.91943